MALEIERKYLVNSKAYRELSESKVFMRQGFLSLDPEKIVRVRIAGDRAWLTIKGQTNKSGTTRFEWETDVDIPSAEQLLALSEGSIIEKYRYTIPYGQHLIEVDEFLNLNEGLIVAEIELETEDQAVDKPEWLGIEVTGDVRYYNARLCTNPFNTWKV